jgi:hypothetical protein
VTSSPAHADAHLIFTGSIGPLKRKSEIGGAFQRVVSAMHPMNRARKQGSPSRNAAASGDELQSLRYRASRPQGYRFASRCGERSHNRPDFSQP